MSTSTPEKKRFIRKPTAAVLLATIGASLAAGIVIGKFGTSHSNRSSYAAGVSAEYKRCMQAQRTEHSLGQIVLSGGQIAAITNGREAIGPELQRLIQAAQTHPSATFEEIAVLPSGAVGPGESNQTEAALTTDWRGALDLANVIHRTLGPQETVNATAVYVGGGANLGNQNLLGDIRVTLVAPGAACPTPAQSLENS